MPSRENRTRRFIGIMSGTSVDAIDAALVEVSMRGDERNSVETRHIAEPRDGTGAGYAARVIGHVEHPWPASLRSRLLAAMAPAIVEMREVCQLHAAVSQQFAAAVEKLLRATRTRRDRIAAIGSHGQTVCHLPPKSRNRSKPTLRTHELLGSTLQLGDVSVLATLTGIPTVGNFRPADMAVGGQGAPLVPWTDFMLLSDARHSRCVQNIGGIANVTYLPRAAAGFASSARAAAAVRAFDTGPGNMTMDAVMALATRGRERFDRDGRHAARGRLDSRLFHRLQQHPFFARKPPKSTGREEFGIAFAREVVHDARMIARARLDNVLHTLARLTAWSIADAYLRFLPSMPEEVILCGGGADNPVLVTMLREEFAAKGPGVVLRRIDEFGIPNKAKEAASFALLAAATLDGRPANLPSVTGARRRVVLGVTAFPNPR